MTKQWAKFIFEEQGLVVKDEKSDAFVMYGTDGSVIFNDGKNEKMVLFNGAPDQKEEKDA